MFKIVSPDVLALVGRIGLSTIFIVSGVGKIFGFEEAANAITDQGLPFPDLGVILAIIVELGGGLMLLIGWNARLAALAITLFILVVTFTFHTFWEFGETEIQNQLHHFMKNFAMVGGMLYVMAFGPGKYCLNVKKKKGWFKLK